MDEQFDNQVMRLEAVLAVMHEEHVLLEALLHRKREAIRAADHFLVRSCTEQENTRVQAIGELEKRRMEIVGDLTLRINPSATAPMSLPELAQLLPEPARGRLLVRRQQLRELMEKVRTEASVVRRATEMLSRHMQGLMQTIGGAIQGGGVYGRRGALPQGAMALSTFNTTA